MSRQHADEDEGQQPPKGYDWCQACYGQGGYEDRDRNWHACDFVMLMHQLLPNALSLGNNWEPV